MERLNRDGSRLAAHFELAYRAILPERAGIHGRYGVCYEDGLIKIRLQHATRGTPLKYSSLVSTLCHELAHLRHFDHGPQFQRLYQQILRWARKSGIYRPRRSEDAETQQGGCRLDPEERARLLEGMRRAVARSRATQLSLFAETS
jgi:WLM domain